MPKAQKSSETDGTDIKDASPVAANQPARAIAKVAGPAKKAPAASAATGRKVPAKTPTGATKSSAPTVKAGGDHVRKAAPKAAVVAAEPAGGHGAGGPTAPDEARSDHEFLAEQRVLLVKEREDYVRQAEELKAEADSLALEHEPGDVQFDEEGGEGGTSNVDRELDLVLSAQARSAILEIDRALVKIEAGTYGRCEQCGRPIPQARLQALPYAALCVACKSGGLSRR